VRSGTQFGDRFEILARAGAGGMGTVYRARDRASEEVVALKVFAPLGAVGQRRFDREASALASIVHPAVVRYIAHGIEDERPWIAMEWLAGETLRDRLARAPLAIDEAVRVVRRAAEGVAAGHRIGIIHRDMKPSNILLVDRSIEGTKVIDFGLARGAEDENLTTTGALLGTVGYMAPEQARSPRDVDARADVFGLAAVLYRCVVGERPYRGRDDVESLVRTVFDEVPAARTLAPDVPGPLSDLLTRALSREPTRRPESAAALAEELTRLLDSMDVAPGTISVPDGLGEREHRIAVLVVVHGDVSSSDLVARHGGTLTRGRSDEPVITFPTEGPATDRAARAARCALDLRRATDAPMTIVARRAHSEPRSAISRSEPGPPRDAIVVDDVAASLLDARFEIVIERGTFVLRGEGTTTATRTLLGKPTPCVGRERELAFLMSLYDECVSDTVARAAIVLAPPGIGKSRLRYELGRRIEARHEASIWIARGDPMRENSPFAIASDALRTVVGIETTDDEATRIAKLRARLGDEPEAERIADFVAEMYRSPGDHEPSTRTNVQLQAARRNALLMADQITRAFSDLMAIECRRAPVVLVLEDLHWGDAPSIALVDAALRTCRDLPLLVLAFARPELRERRPGLWSDRGAIELPLPELSRKAAERLARTVLPHETDEAIARIVDQSGGNAFYLEELIRAVSEGRRDDLPESVVAMAQARIETLESDARRVLRAASVFGMAFHRAGVHALVAPLDESPWIDELVRREFIQRRPTSRLLGQEELVFRHAFMREAAYSLLLVEDRALGHRLAGEWLEGAGERDSRMLADHFARGGVKMRAAIHHRRAAEQAYEANDLTTAAAEAEAAIGAGASGEEYAHCARVLAEVQQWIGDTHAAERWGLEAMTRSRPGTAVWCDAAGVCAAAAGRRGNSSRLVWLGEQLKAARAHRVSERAWVMAATRCATQMQMTGEYGSAIELYDLIDEVATPLMARDPFIEARVESCRGFRGYFEGNPIAQMVHGLRSADASERAGDLRQSYIMLMNAGLGYLEVADWVAGERAIRSAMEGARRLGLDNLAAASQNNLGWAIACSGRLEEARTELIAAIARLEGQLDLRMLGGARMHLARVHLLAHEYDQAEREAIRAAEDLAAAAPLRPQAFAIMAFARLATGRIDAAMDAAAEAKRQLDFIGKLDMGDEPYVIAAYAAALQAKGDLAGAEAARAEGARHLLKRAAFIEDPQLRSAYLHDRVDHALFFD
jgi:eukaryotic-like serine/threonine-protein kinase